MASRAGSLTPSPFSVYWPYRDRPVLSCPASRAPWRGPVSVLSRASFAQIGASTAFGRSTPSYRSASASAPSVRRMHRLRGRGAAGPHLLHSESDALGVGPLESGPWGRVRRRLSAYCSSLRLVSTSLFTLFVSSCWLRALGQQPLSFICWLVAAKAEKS